MEHFLTVQQIAEVLQVQPSTIYQWTHQGFIPHVKLGRLVRFREGDVLEWMQKRSCGGRTTRTPNISGLLSSE